MRILNRHSYHSQNRGAVGVIKSRNIRVLSVCRKRVLGKIIRAYAEKIDFARKQVAYHHCRRGFYHYPEFNRVVAEEMAKHIEPALPGKTLIFAATDAKDVRGV